MSAARILSRRRELGGGDIAGELEPKGASVTSSAGSVGTGRLKGHTGAQIWSGYGILANNIGRMAALAG